MPIRLPTLRPDDPVNGDWSNADWPKRTPDTLEDIGVDLAPGEEPEKGGDNANS